MENFKSINDVLDFAIEQEQEAIDFYTELAKQAKSKDVKEIFLEFVKEEINHKSKLMKIKAEGNLATISDDSVQDLLISNYLAPVKPSHDMSYQDTLIVVMKKEKAAYNLYKTLSKISTSQEMKDIFNRLAMEEANHKLQFEKEYDDNILKNN